MAKANRVHSTPRRTASKSKAPPTKKFTSQPTDPIFAVLDAWRRAATLWVPVNGEMPDELSDQHFEAFNIVIRTRPTTLAGLAALTNWTRLYANSMDIDGEDLSTASIADAAAALVEWSAVLCGDVRMLEASRGVPPSMMVVRKPARRKAVV
jgi:hypothetical protein